MNINNIFLLFNLQLLFYNWINIKKLKLNKAIVTIWLPNLINQYNYVNNSYDVGDKDGSIVIIF